MKYTVYIHFLKGSDSKKKEGDQKQKQKTGNTHHLRHNRWNHAQSVVTAGCFVMSPSSTLTRLSVKPNNMSN